MNFNLRAPCGQCPFRNDVSENYGWLGESRAAGIAKSLEEYAFPCHKTVFRDEEDNQQLNPKEQGCYGAIVVMEHEGRLFDNPLMQIAERFGLYQIHEINLALPVVRSRAQFVAMHSDGFYSNAMISILQMTQAEKMALVSTLKL